jgi:hypothetical protein
MKIKKFNEDYSDVIAELKSMSAKEQWQWIISSDIKDQFKIDLDNDTTFLSFGESGYVVLKSDIGNREGTIHLLEALGIKADYV